jgi:hypothetical protein
MIVLDISMYSIIKLPVPLQPFVNTLRPLPLTPQIHTPKPPHSPIAILKYQIFWLVYLNLLVNMHSAVFCMYIDQPGDGHCVLHALLHGGRVGGMEDEVEKCVGMPVECKSWVCGWEAGWNVLWRDRL